MAVSSSTDFSLNGTQIVTEARRLLGIQASEEPLTNAELDVGLTHLNLLLKGWQAQGVMAWTYTEGQLTLVDGTASYLFGSGGAFTTAVPHDLIDVRITRSSIDLRMTELSREEYYGLPNKTTEGYPTQWFYDRQRSSGTLYVWPVPDATAGTLKFTYRRQIMDMDAGANDMDLPPEWVDAVVYGLADRLGDIYAKQDPMITAKAARAFTVARQFDGAEGAGVVSILPAGLGY